MAGEHLKKITTRAKALRKKHPNTEWKNLVKKAAAELKTGKVAGNKKSSATKKNKAMTKAGTKTVVVAGHKGHQATKKSKPRKVSGIKKHMGVMEAGKMLVGGILGGMAGAVIYPRLPGNHWVKGGVQTAIGWGGMVMTGNKHPFLFGVANGIGVGGGVNVLHSSGAIHGVNDMIAGLFDGGSTEHNFDDIPEGTAGHKHITEPYNGYVGTMSADDIDKWVTEGVPGLGGDDYLYR